MQKYFQNGGLYRSENEHDSCGVGFIANIKGIASRSIVKQAIEAACKIEHRGAIGADPDTGDGMGILIQIPDKFFREELGKSSVELPKKGEYGIGFFFLPPDEKKRENTIQIINEVVERQQLNMLAWRDVPCNSQYVGKTAKLTLPFMKQCFISSKETFSSSQDFERKLYHTRKVIDSTVRKQLKLSQGEYYVPSFSSQTIVYKGMLLGHQYEKFFVDLQNPAVESAIAIFHMRYSTNTFPSWDLAQPFRYLGHNGEINTLKGNKNWMLTRQRVMQSSFFQEKIRDILPVVLDSQSDSASFDSVLELLFMNGRSLAHAMMMMIPEAWSKNPTMDKTLKSFYEYNAMMMEPWDGPAAMVFSDGRFIGATLDRNGLRPARYIITKDDCIIMASEVGSIDIPFENIVESARLEPGRMLLVDTKEQRIISNDELKQQISSQKPYHKWIARNLIKIDNITKKQKSIVDNQYHANTIRKNQKNFGYTREKLLNIIKRMAEDAKEPVGSMGADVSLAIFSEKQPLLFRYFKQLFAQVTNPAIDAIREELVMELTSYIGPEQNILSESPEHARRIELSHPVLTGDQMFAIQNKKKTGFQFANISLLFPIEDKNSMQRQIQLVFEQAEKSIVEDNVSFIILSDKGVNYQFAAIPSLLAVAGLHNYLIQRGLRTKVGLIIETGEASEVFDFALLCGYGANAIYPYLAYETIAELLDTGFLEITKNFDEAQQNYLCAIEKGLFKIFSKMGISTLQSYCGAQIFEAIGISDSLIDTFFTGTVSQIGGIDLPMLEKETRERHTKAEFAKNPNDIYLDVGGFLHYRVNGENHLWTPITVAKLQQSTINNDYQLYKEYSSLINNQQNKHITLRSLLDFQNPRKPIPLEEVEPVSEIVKRFSTGAMSYGSISWEAHTSLAIAMNRIGGKSNTGEGGEDPLRFIPLENGDSMRSSIKQVASGRFGVTANYLFNADELQIKVAQGAKPGEGGQLPGLKVDSIIAKVRHSTPGVTLISPPPHHDIYSIEDLKQLIFDLKNSNPKARISVKLVSEVGVGTIAAGVVKAHADHVVIAGHDGGTGASPISSIHSAGTPWELGLTETHQTLVINGLRDRVYLSTDGQIRTGRDVVIAAILGADEFGFSTSALVTQGCIYTRKCHLNTCPVGVATQDKSLRKKFTGNPDYLVNYMLFVAKETREVMAELGYASINELIGQTQNLVQKKDFSKETNWKLPSLDLSKILEKPNSIYKTKLYRAKEQDHQISKQKDNQFIKQAKNSIKTKSPIDISAKVYNVDRTLGTLLSYEVTKAYGEHGLPDRTITLDLHGNAGQSLGAFLNKGILLNLKGIANDYVAKGLSGGIIVVQPDKSKAVYKAEENVIVGNVCLYGATAGEFYVNGLAGERFAIRNSGATAVVEGVGEHACEYMTGGMVVVLSSIGRNFAAGMSGGIAVVFDEDGTAESKINMEMVKLYPLEKTQYISQVLAAIQSHYQYTKSALANSILQNWNDNYKKFLLVMPTEYEMAMQKIQKQDKEKEKVVL